jgi:hypothetical protein
VAPDGVHHQPRAAARGRGRVALARRRPESSAGPAFAWVKIIAGQAKTNFRGTARVSWAFTLATAAYNLIRLPKLMRVLP